MGTEDKLSNAAKDAKGKVMESAGKATDDEELEGRGKGEQVEAKAQKAGEHVKDAAGNVKDALKK
jgi:uncharacterized protein YjbJ (UPF0337 family)